MNQLGESDRQIVESAYKTAITGLDNLEKELETRMLLRDQIQIQAHKRAIRIMMEFWLAKQTGGDIKHFKDNL